MARLPGNHSSKIAPIKFDLPTNSTIRLRQALPIIIRSVVIDGGTVQNLRVDGAGQFQVFDFFDIGTLAQRQFTIRNLTISHGSAAYGGGIDNSGVGSRGNLNLYNVTLRFNEATTGDGGAIVNTSTLGLWDCRLYGNEASQLGGAIRNSGNALIYATVIGPFNNAGSGGGIANRGLLKIFAGSQIIGNYARGDGGRPTSGDGGGIWNNGTLAMSAALVRGNSATLEGGGLCNVAQAVLVTLTDIAFILNRVLNPMNSLGGAMYLGRLTNTTLNTCVAWCNTCANPNGGSGICRYGDSIYVANGGVFIGGNNVVIEPGT